jgi:hypothetical protein
MDKKIEAKNRLEESKNRLASAFNRLEGLIEQKIIGDNKEIAELSSLKEKLSLMSQENYKLATNLNNLETDYLNIKSLGLEVMDELNSSINSIESILGTDNGDS